MTVNGTCGMRNGNGNETVACGTPSYTAGLAAGLTIFFLLLMIVAGFLVYKFHGTVRKMFRSEHRRSVKKEEYRATPQADPHPYSTREEQPTVQLTVERTVQAPIYENLNTRANRKPSKPSRSSREPEEDVYLQCDAEDDVIYNNDPACNLSLLSDSQEEDVYIVPDAL